jgi:hypothetical protein
MSMAVKPIDMAIAIFIGLLLSMQLQLLMNIENCKTIIRKR